MIASPSRAAWPGPGPPRDVTRPEQIVAGVEEVGALAVYLASPASDFMTGQTGCLDGGQTMAW